MAIFGNKGEWSEMYVLFKLLGDGIVFAGDGDLNKLEEIFYPILKILRQEKEGKYAYSIEDDIVVVTEDGEELLRKNVAEFLYQATILIQRIQKEKGSFNIPEVERFMKDIHCSTLKAKSSDKTDIRIVIHDPRTGMTPTLGFSIKSQVGNDATLLNASKATNFIYMVSGKKLSARIIKSINEISTRNKIMDRVKAIINQDALLDFCGMYSNTFCNNLILIDSCLPQIVAGILLNRYILGTTDLSQLTDYIAQKNPIGYDVSQNHRFYEHKIKNLLVASALGMVPDEPWNGRYDANGGYLVVKDDGDVLCYHFYDRNLIEDYLFKNVKLETPSSSRHDFATIYEENGKQLFKLNLQIRFK